MIFSSVLAFLFLYFPEDKSEYIPAVINLIIFSILAYLAVRVFMNISKREEKKGKGIRGTFKETCSRKGQLNKITFHFFKKVRLNQTLTV